MRRFIEISIKWSCQLKLWWIENSISFQVIFCSNHPAGCHPDWAQHWKVSLWNSFWFWFHSSELRWSLRTQMLDELLAWVDSHQCARLKPEVTPKNITSKKKKKSFHIVSAMAKHFSFHFWLKTYFASVLCCYSIGFFLLQVCTETECIFLYSCFYSKMWIFLVCLIACSDISLCLLSVIVQYDATPLSNFTNRFETTKTSLCLSLYSFGKYTFSAT